MNALIVLLILFLTGCSEQQTPPADSLFRGGVIYTADATQSVASAIAIRDDRVVYIGSDESAAGFIGPNTEVTELQGKMIIPGLHDVHVHLPGIVQTDSCDLASLPFSLEELVPRLKTCTADIPPGEWLLVNQWSFTWGNEPSQRLPTLRAALDAVSTEHPIVLLGNDGHQRRHVDCKL
jgi:predicted amidohydrolase YtcJ